MMKPCVEYQKWLMLDAHGELAPADRSELMRHLSACPACRREREALQQFIGRASALHPAPALTADESARLTRGIMQHLPSKAQRGPRRLPRRFGALPGWGRMAAAAACLILAVAGGFQVWRNAGEPSRTAAGPGMEEQALVQNLDLLENLELLEEFDELEKLVQVTDPPEKGDGPPKQHPTTGTDNMTGGLGRWHAA